MKQLYNNDNKHVSLSKSYTIQVATTMPPLECKVKFPKRVGQRKSKDLASKPYNIGMA